MYQLNRFVGPCEQEEVVPTGEDTREQQVTVVGVSSSRGVKRVEESLSKRLVRTVLLLLRVEELDPCFE